MLRILTVALLVASGPAFAQPASPGGTHDIRA